MYNHPLYGNTYADIRDLLSRLFGRQSPVNQGVQRVADASAPPVPTGAGPFIEPAPAAPASPMMVAAPRAPMMADDGAMASSMQAPVREGPNSRIDADTRARALAWALRNAQAGGA